MRYPNKLVSNNECITTLVYLTSYRERKLHRGHAVLYSFAQTTNIERQRQKMKWILLGYCTHTWIINNLYNLFISMDLLFNWVYTSFLASFHVGCRFSFYEVFKVNCQTHRDWHHFLTGSDANKCTWVFPNDVVLTCSTCERNCTWSSSNLF